MYFSSREQTILRLLMNSDEKWTVKKLAAFLGVSERTIHRDLSGAETSLEEIGLSLRKKTGVGISLEGKPAGFEKLRSVLAYLPETEFTPEERKSLLLCTLLMTSEPVKLIALAQDLHITPATVSQDLSRVEGWLESFGLKLVKRRSWGIQITGKEKDRRVAMRSLLAQYFDEAEILGMLRRSIQRKVGDHSELVMDRLLGMVEREKLSVVEDAVKGEIRNLPYTLADSAYIGLVVHLALAVERIERGETLTFDSNLLSELQMTREYGISTRIAGRLQSLFRLEFPESEVANIAIHLQGAKLGNDREHWFDSETGPVMEARELIDRVEQKLDVPLADDPSLMQGLLAHLKRAVYRIKRSLPIHNPLLSRIEGDYPAVFAAVTQAVKEIFPQYQVPQEEIGYLVMHFGSALERKRQGQPLSALVVCASGIGTSKLLVSQLQTAFPEIGQVRNASVFELQQLSPTDYDLVISTIPLEMKGVDVLFVHPYLTEEDVAKIRIYLDKRKRHRFWEKPQEQVGDGKSTSQQRIESLEKIQLYVKTTMELLKGFSLSSLPGGRLQGTLEQACKKLEEAGVLRDRKVVLNRLLERAQGGGLGIPDTGMALFHARSGEILRPSFTMYNLIAPLSVEGMDGSTMPINHLLLMLAPEETPEPVLNLLSRISALTIENPHSMGVFQSKNEGQIQTYLTEHLSRYVYDQIDEQRSR